MYINFPVEKPNEGLHAKIDTLEKKQNVVESEPKPRKISLIIQFASLVDALIPPNCKTISNDDM